MGRAVWVLLATGLALAPGSGRSSAEPARGDPAARLLAAEHASDVWDLTVELSDGHWVVAQATINNLGPSDRTGAVVGHVVGPDGAAHEFHKVRRAGAWELSADRRGIDLGAIRFDQSGGRARLHVDKKRVDLDLEIDLGGGPAWSDSLTGPQSGFDLLALAAPVRGTLELENEPAREVSGRAALTHRWMSALENELVDRRVELFALEGAGGLYLHELTTAAGETRRWLVVAREGRIVESTAEVRVEALPNADGGLTIDSILGSGRIAAQSVLLRDEPLERAPWLVRWWLGRLTWPRFVWSAAPFDFVARDRNGEGPLRLSGRGLVNVSRFDVGGSDSTALGDVWGSR
jgi:hypothetical protein